VQKVAVIMPCFNCQGTVSTAVQSVLSQRFTNLKLYAVDDCSTDGTSKILSRFAKLDDRVVHKTNTMNCGVAYSRNVAMALSREDVVAFIDADDIWSPEKLEKQYALLKRSNDDVVGSHAAYFSFLDKDPLSTCKYRPAKHRVGYLDLLRHNYIGNCTGVYVRSRIREGLFQNEIRHEDYDFWLQVSQHGDIVSAGAQPLAAYRQSINSLSANKLRSQMWHWSVMSKFVPNYAMRLTYFSRHLFEHLYSSTITPLLGDACAPPDWFSSYIYGEK
jgi:glycosyltransferase involved in cell wall biosynthesis